MHAVMIPVPWVGIFVRLFKQENINDMKAEGKGRSVQQPRKTLKFGNILTVVPLLFSLYANVCKHKYGDFTGNEKEKSQYC